MGLSVWGMIAAPLMTPAAPAPHIDATPLVEEIDLFSGDAVLDIETMSDAAGGTEAALNFEDVGVNIADSNASVSDVNFVNANSGQITDNVVSNNSGVTTVYNNTGNGVIFQSTLQINVFLGENGSN